MHQNVHMEKVPSLLMTGVMGADEEDVLEEVAESDPVTVG
jgi:hypothetical protein